MADYIDREEAVDALFHHLPSSSRKECRLMLYEVQSADVVEVVLCRDCRNWDKSDGYRTLGRCKVWNTDRGWKEYCSEGERKDGGPN